MHTEEFTCACELIIEKTRERKLIGTLGEKTLHAVLKHAYEPDQSCHEVKIGTYYADIYNKKGIMEIQTRNFHALRTKLSFFLETETVTIVYPIPYHKWLVWIDNETGEASKKRKSPKTGQVYEAFYELYKIKQLLTNPNLKLCIVMLDVTEYRNLNGWSSDKKKGSSRFDRIPERLVEEVHIGSISEYSKLIPDELPKSFTSKDFQKVSRLSLPKARTAVNVLKYVGAIRQIGKQGNMLIYEKI